MIEYKTDSNNLIIDDKTITFSHSIRDVKEIQGILIVLLHNANSNATVDQPENNVYGVSSKGEVLWVLFDIVKTEAFGAGTVKTEDDYLVVIDAFGYHYKIDVVGRLLISKIGYW